MEVSDAAVKGSHLIPREIAVASKPLSDEEFSKSCLLKAIKIVCPEKRQCLASVSLKRSTISDLISDIAAGIDGHFKEEVAFFIAVDESTDLPDTVQFAIVIRGVDRS